MAAVPYPSRGGHSRASASQKSLECSYQTHPYTNFDVPRIVALAFHHPKVLSGQNTCGVQRTWPSIGLAKK